MRHIAIVGAGPGDPGLLSCSARDALRGADLVVGARRLVEGAGGASCAGALPALFEGARTVVAARAADVAHVLASDRDWVRACVLMSGDTGLFSGAAGTVRAVADEPGLADCAVEVIPGISSASMLAARLGRPWQGWRFVTAHGAACDIVGEAARGGTVFLVTSGATGPAELCGRLVAAGLGDVEVVVAERLSYADERIESGMAGAFVDRTFDPLNVMLVDLEGAGAGARPWPWATPGIPDERFERGRVPMTKQEVRAVALAKLRVAATDTVFDVGAGTGSVTVELGLLARAGEVYAIERKPEAVELCRRNVAAFGLDNVRIVEGEAPGALRDLPAPDAVFVGGSGGALAGIMDALRSRAASCRICLTCVSLETLAEVTRLLAAPDIEDVDICQVSVARAERAGFHSLMRASNPVFIVSARLGRAAGVRAGDAS